MKSLLRRAVTLMVFLSFSMTFAGCAEKEKAVPKAPEVLHAFRGTILQFLYHEEDGKVVASGNSGDVIGGAAVGGLIFGGVGAIVGSLAGASSPTDSEWVKGEEWLLLTVLGDSLADTVTVEIFDPKDKGRSISSDIGQYGQVISPYLNHSAISLRAMAYHMRPSMRIEIAVPRELVHSVIQVTTSTIYLDDQHIPSLPDSLR